MWETYRMLGKQREEELLREAARLHHLSSRTRRPSWTRHGWELTRARKLLAAPVAWCVGVWAAFRADLG
jgi:hypothetical protein